VQQSRIACCQEPRSSLGGGALRRAVARGEHGRSGRRRSYARPDIKSRQGRSRIQNDLIQCPLRVIGTARRKWPLRRKDPPLHRVTDSDRDKPEAGAACHDRLALFDGGEV
jgi:hypothetical protein